MASFVNVSWAEIVEHCSPVKSQKRKTPKARTPDVHEMPVLINGRTRALVVPFKMVGNQWGMTVQAAKGVPDAEFWRFDTDEQLDRFKLLVDGGKVQRVAVEDA